VLATGKLWRAVGELARRFDAFWRFVFAISGDLCPCFTRYPPSLRTKASYRPQVICHPPNHI